MSLPHALCLVSLLSRSFSLVLSLAITLAFHSFSPRPSVSVSISASVLIISDVINLSFSPFVSLFLSRSSLLPRYLPFSNIARPAGQFGAPVDPDPVFARSLNWGIPTKLDEHSHRSDVGLMYTDARGASSELLGCVVTSRPQSGVGAGGQHALEAAAAVRPPPLCSEEDLERRLAVQLAWMHRFPRQRTPCCRGRFCFRCKISTWHRGVACRDRLQA